MWYGKKRLDLLVRDNYGLRTELQQCDSMESCLSEVTSSEMLDIFMPKALKFLNNRGISLTPDYVAFPFSKQKYLLLNYFVNHQHRITTSKASSLNKEHCEVWT